MTDLKPNPEDKPKPGDKSNPLNPKPGKPNPGSEPERKPLDAGHTTKKSDLVKRKIIPQQTYNKFAARVLQSGLARAAQTKLASVACRYLANWRLFKEWKASGSWLTFRIS